jgi:hypothetical protein
MKIRWTSLIILLFVLLVLIPLYMACKAKDKEPFESIPIMRPKPGKPCCGKGSFCPVYVYYPYDEVTGTLL